MTNARQLWRLAAVGGMVAAACTTTADERVLGIDATGFVGGLVYWDVNGNRKFDVPDVSVEGVLVSLRVSEVGGVVTVAVSDPAGQFQMRDVPVGRYHVGVDTTTLGDTAKVVRIDTSVVELAPEDSAAGVKVVRIDTTVVELAPEASAAVAVAVSFPIVTVAEARALPLGDKVFIIGEALMESGTFGDTTVHVADTSGALRVTRVRAPALFPGDSVRLRGTVSTRDGQPTLDDASPFIIRFGPPPEPTTVPSGQAATADVGKLDAALVAVADAVVNDTATVDDDFVAMVDDGSGTVEVIFDGNVGFDLEPIVPDTVISVKGVLVPSGVGVWALKPRSAADVNVP
jgi:hypothetical protein